ncbi:MAG: hypothetical protein ABL888_21675 [Pirellulaceae bacterium]
MKITSYLTAAILCFLASFSSNLIADGNIEVTVRRGDLRIQGGRALGQALWVKQTAVPGRYLLATNGSTTLNGLATLTVDGITGDVDIRLRADQSVVIMTDDAEPRLTIQGDLSINLASRTSAILLLDAVDVYGSSRITTGNGQDALLAGRNWFRNGARVRMGGGDDVYYGYQSSSGYTNIDMGSDNDILMSNGEGINLADFNMGSGDDLLAVDSSLDFAEIDGGSGLDAVLFDGGGLVDLTSNRRFEVPFSGTLNDAAEIAYYGSRAYADAFMIWIFAGLDL